MRTKGHRDFFITFTDNAIPYTIIFQLAVRFVASGTERHILRGTQFEF
jgi:hypothetical protein